MLSVKWIDYFTESQLCWFFHLWELLPSMCYSNKSLYDHGQQEKERAWNSFCHAWLKKKKVFYLSLLNGTFSFCFRELFKDSSCCRSFARLVYSQAFKNGTSKNFSRVMQQTMNVLTTINIHRQKCPQLSLSSFLPSWPASINPTD